MKILEIMILVIALAYHNVLLFVNNRRNGGVTVSSGVLFAIILYFDIIPLIIYFGNGGNQSFAVNQIYNTSISKLLWAEVNIFTFTTMFYFCEKHRIVIRKRDYLYECNEENKAVDILSMVSLIVGGVCFLLYINSFGGFGNLLKNSARIRSFSIDSSNLVSSTARRLIVPARMIIAAPVLLLTRMNISSKRTRIYKVLFVIAVSLSIMFLLFNAGKTALIIFFIPLVLPILSRVNKHPWMLLITFGIVSLPVLGILDSLFFYIGYGRWLSVDTNIQSYISGFAYPFCNVLNLSEIANISGYRFFSTFFTSLLSVLPGVNFTPEYDYTSTFYHGVNWRNISGVPIDIITLGYIQFSIIGVAAVGFAMGILINRINERVTRINYETYKPLIYAVIANMFSYVVNSDITSNLKGSFTLIFGLICLLAACSRRKESLSAN